MDYKTAERNLRPEAERYKVSALNKRTETHVIILRKVFRCGGKQSLERDDAGD